MSWLSKCCGAIALAGLLGPGPATAEVKRDMVDAAIAELRSYIEKQIAADEVPGLAVAVVFDDEVVYLDGFGVREAGKPETVDADTVFQLAGGTMGGPNIASDTGPPSDILDI